MSLNEHQIYDRQKEVAYEDDPVRYDALEAVYGIFVDVWEKDYEDFEEDVTEIFRGWMQEFYRRLESEYEYLMSDYAVKEHIECNEYEFTEEGDIYL